MKEISSKDNRIVRETASLSEKKYRDASGLFVVEGPNLVREALSEGIVMKYVFILSGAENEEICSLTEAVDPSALYTVSREAYSRMSQTDTPQGILAVAKRRDFSESIFFGERGSNILVLDRIQDPGNTGTLLRTADAAGFSGVMLIKGSADPYGPKVVRAAAGSLFRMPLMTGVTPEKAAGLFEKYGKTAFAAAMDGDTPYYSVPLASDAALIVGNEGNGVSDELLNISRHISIPMAGRTESLNAALAAGIIMFEALRQKSLEK